MVAVGTFLPELDSAVIATLKYRSGKWAVLKSSQHADRCWNCGRDSSFCFRSRKALTEREKAPECSKQKSLAELRNGILESSCFCFFQ